MSKFLKIQYLAPLAAIAAGSVYYSTLNNTPPETIFKGDGQWVDLKLTHIKDVSGDSKLFTFEFPHKNDISGLVTASAVLTKFVTPKGSNVIRPYTPVNDIEHTGSLHLLIKHYEGGKMSSHIFGLKPNDTLAFKGPIVKWKWAPNSFKEISLIGGGTGITPLYQLLHEILKNKNDKTKINLLYGSKTPKDILLKPELDDLAKKFPEQFNVQYFVDKADGDESKDITVGFINESVLKSTLPKASEDSHVFVCGPPPLYKAISGNKVSPSDQGEVTGILADLGFDKSNVFKF